MEIYDHNDIMANAPKPSPQKNTDWQRTVIIGLLCICLALAAGTFFMLLFRKPEKKNDFASAYAAVRSSVTEVYGVSADGSGTVGSGVTIAVRGGKTYILTNYHVTGNGPVSVRFSEYGEKVGVTLLGYDMYHDLAVVEADGDRGSRPVQAADTPREGSELLAVGNNLGYGIAAFDGILSRTNRMYTIFDDFMGSTKSVPVLGVTCPINAGMSGGGVFTLDGKIIGISAYQTTAVSGGTRPTDGASYAIPYAIAERVAAQILAERSGGQIEKILVTGAVGAEDTIDFAGLYFTAKFTDDGLRVVSVADELPSEVLGGVPQTGDLVRSVGDLRITADTGFAAVFAECLRYVPSTSLSSPQLSVVFMRGSESVSVRYYGKRQKT